MSIILGTNITDNTAICDLGAFGDFVTVDKKQVLVPWISPITWKRHPLFLETSLLYLSLLGTFTRFRNYWVLTVLGQMTAFTITGCRVRSPVSWSINAQSSPYGRTRGAGLMDAEVRVLMVATWFSLRYFT